MAAGAGRELGGLSRTIVSRDIGVDLVRRGGECVPQSREERGCAVAQVTVGLDALT